MLRVRRPSRTQIREPTSEKQDRQLHTHHTAIVTVGGGCDEPKKSGELQDPHARCHVCSQEEDPSVQGNKACMRWESEDVPVLGR